MAEVALAMGLFAALALTAWVAHMSSWLVLLRLGIVFLTVGTVASCMTGLAYHLLLARCVACRQGRVPQWWWSPTRLHPYLSNREQWRVLPWFYAGALSFCVVMFGALWTLLAVARAGH